LVFEEYFLARGGGSLSLSSDIKVVELLVIISLLKGMNLLGGFGELGGGEVALFL
jgi:hypothetical protein